MRKWIILLVIFLLGAGAGGWYLYADANTAVNYRTVPIQRGDLVTTISATGTLEPEEVVDVGAQVGGQILSFGKDASGNTIDYRSPVKADMILAEIDQTISRADLDTSKAQLEQANTAVTKGEADLLEAQAKALQAEGNWNRAKQMGPSDALSQNDYDMYQADYETAKANVAIAQSEIAQAKSGILLAQAAVDKATRNVKYCTIKSPVDGEVIDRRVNIGQTIVSSMSATSLFLIAKDLTKMQIWVAVNEADVGRILPGTPVTFTCDTFHDQTFVGKVGKVRLNATMTQNVVMYTVEVEADNPKKILLPYLTARVDFEVDRQNGVLMVPNASLRWFPASMSQVDPVSRDKFKPTADEAATPPDGAGGAGGKKSKKKGGGGHKSKHGMIWVTSGKFVKPIDVTLGNTDGVNTAVSADGLAEGASIVIGEQVASNASAAEVNPFLPHRHS